MKASFFRHEAVRGFVSGLTALKRTVSLQQRTLSRSRALSSAEINNPPGFLVEEPNPTGSRPSDQRLSGLKARRSDTDEGAEDEVTGTSGLTNKLRLRKHRNEKDKEPEKAASTRGGATFPERGA